MWDVVAEAVNHLRVAAYRAAAAVAVRPGDPFRLMRGRLAQASGMRRRRHRRMSYNRPV